MRAEGEGAEKGWEQLLSKVEHKVLSNRALGYRAEIKRQALRPGAGHFLLASDSHRQVVIWKTQVIFIVLSKDSGVLRSANHMYTP